MKCNRFSQADGFELFHGSVGPRQEIVDVGLRVAVDDFGEGVGEVGPGIDGVDFAGLDQ